MAKKDIEKAVRNLLMRSKKPLDECEISKRTGINFWDITDTVDSFKRRGLVIEVR